MYCTRTARQATPQECHETIAQTADSALYSTCRACATGQRLMASVQWAKEGGADASPIYNDEETIMTKKTTKTATAPTTETPAQTPATAEAKTYTIKDLCEEIGLPYGTVYAAVRHLSRRGNVATSPSHKKIQGALDALGIRPADIVAERRRKKPEDSPLDELEAAQALGIAVAPALEESKMPDVPAADPAALQPDEGDPGTLDQAVDEVAQLTAMPSPASLRIQNQPVFPDDELFQDAPREGVAEQAVINSLSTLQRTPWGHAMYDARGDLNVSLHELSDMVGVTPSRLSEAEYGLEVLTPEERSLVEEALCMTFSRVVPLSLETFPLEALLTELQRRMPQAEVVVRIGPAAAA